MKVQLKNTINDNILMKSIFSYLITSEYFAISDNDNLPGHIDTHLPLQLEEVFGTAIVHIDQVTLKKRKTDEDF